MSAFGFGFGLAFDQRKQTFMTQMQITNVARSVQGISKNPTKYTKIVTLTCDTKRKLLTQILILLATAICFQKKRCLSIGTFEIT